MPDQQPTAAKAPDFVPPRLAGRVFAWFDERLGVGKLLHELLDEPIPDGPRLAYVFGSALLAVFLLQIVTGIALLFYYAPTVDHAHTSVAYIMKVVTAGSFIRGLHVYGASAMIILLLLHLIQTFFYGSYKGRRELQWVSGFILFGLVLGMGFTGYLLPWDEKAYFATKVGTNVPSEIPVVGEATKRLLLRGDHLGALTLSGFFVMHVFIISGLIVLFIAPHLFLLRKRGAAGPTHEDPIEPKLKTAPFYPGQVARLPGNTSGNDSNLLALRQSAPENSRCTDRADSIDALFQIPPPPASNGQVSTGYKRGSGGSPAGWAQGGPPNATRKPPRNNASP